MPKVVWDGGKQAAADQKLNAALGKLDSSKSKLTQDAGKQLRQATANQRAAQKILASETATAEQKKQALQIVNPDKPNKFKSALGSIGNSVVGKGVGALIDVMDTPRAAVVSALSEGTDLLWDAFNLQGHEYVDASFGDLVGQARSNKGFGSVFREKAAASAAGGEDSVFGIKVFKNGELAKTAPQGGDNFQEWLADPESGKKLKYTGAGKALGITAGITGDIGLDPLTYVSMGGSRLAGLGADAVADTAIKAGRADIAQKAATKGKWSLSSKELEAIGLAGEGGIHFRVPGTGKIGRSTINRGLDGPMYTGAIRGTADKMKFTPVGGYQSMRAWARGGVADKGAAKLLGGKYATLRDQFVKGTPEEFRQAFETIQSDRVAIGWEKTFADDAMRQWVKYETDIKRLNLNPEDVYHALADTDDAMEATQRILQVDGGAEFLANFRTWAQNDLPTQLNVHAGRTQPGSELIKNFRDGWQPSLRPAETKQFLIETYGEKLRGFGGTRAPLGKASFETQANIVEGGEFMGVQLVSPSDAKAIYGEALDPRDQAHKILEQRIAAMGGDRVMAMFETDITKSMPAAIRNMSHRVYTAQLENQLLERGVATSLNRNALDTQLLFDEAVLTQAKRYIQDLRLDQRTAAAELRSSKDLLGSITQRAKVFQNLAENRQVRRTRTLAAASNAIKPELAENVRLMQEAVESANRLQSLLPEMRDGTTALLKMIDNPALVGDPAYGELVQRLTALRGEMDRSYATMGKLVRRREQIGTKLAKLEAELDSKVQKATQKLADRDRLAAEMAEVEGTLAELRGLQSAVQQELDPDALARVEVLGQRLQDVKAARDLVEQLDSIRNATDPAYQSAELARVESMLRNNFWTDLSGQDTAGALTMLRTVERDMTNALGDARRALDNGSSIDSAVNAAALRLDGLQTQAQQLGRPDLFEQIAQMRQNLPVNEGAALVNPAHPEGLWFLAESTDNLVGGLRFVQEGTEAGAVVKVTNPKIYGDLNAMDLAWEHRQVAAYGTKAPNARRVMQNDMLREAVAAGDIKARDLPKDMQAGWRQVERAVADGQTLDRAVTDVFGERLGLATRNYDVAGIDDTEWVLSQFADRLVGVGGVLSADVKDRVLASFKQRLANTHDAIILPNGNGQWDAIILNADVVETTGGTQVRGATTLQRQYETMQSNLNRKLDELRAQSDAVGVDLDLAHANFQHIERAVIDSNARKAELEKVLRSRNVAQLDEKLGFEFALRDEVERLGSLASGHRSRVAKLYNDFMTLADDMGRAKAADDLEIESLLAQQAEIKAATAAIEADMFRRNRELGRVYKKLNKYEGKVAQRMERNLAVTGDPRIKRVRDVVDESMKLHVRMLSADSYAPNFIVQAVTDMTRVIGAPDGTHGMLKAFDRVTNLWKAQAIMRPGFHIRNYMGGVINNWIANVEFDAYGQFTKRFSVYRKAVKGGTPHEEALRAVEKAFGRDDAIRIGAIVESGIVSGGQAAETNLLAHAHATNLNPFSMQFKGYAVNAEGMARIENHLRGTLAWDRMNKGLGMDAVMGDVARYHFDYDDLSRFERSFVRRVVPFYTWTRKNLPLQVEMLLENPKQVTRFMNIKADVESVSEDEDLYPNWFNSNLPIRLPFKIGNDQAYGFADAPFKELATTLSPSRAMESMNPFIKAPIELRTGTKFFGNIPFQEGYQPVPSVWDNLFIPEVMSMFGRASKDANGNWVMRDKDLYLVEQWVPFLAQSRRMLPSEERFEKRRTYTWATFMLGQSVRVNTQQDKNSELIRRSEALKSFTKDLETKGYLE